MVSPDDVVKIYKQLTDQNIRVWLTGGWGIDALLSEHTRPHKDLDVIMLLNDVNRISEHLGQFGYALKELWSENRWAIDAKGVPTATAFVLRNAEGRELDAHAMRLDQQGNGIIAWENQEGFSYTRADLAGKDLVTGYPVQCVSAENQMICNTGYLLPDYQWRDLEQLREMFGVEFPAELSSQRAGRNSR